MEEIYNFLRGKKISFNMNMSFTVSFFFQNIPLSSQVDLYRSSILIF